MYIIFFVITVFAFIAELIICLKIENHGIKKRIEYLIFTTSLFVIEYGFCSLFDYLTIISVMNFAFAIMLFIPLLYVKKRKVNIVFNEEELSDLIKDREIKPLIKENLIKEKQPLSKPEIDYSHVKNLLERLDFMNLSSDDKRQVRELELSIKESESGEESKEIKNKINDGISALLKIMSKYGV